MPVDLLDYKMEYNMSLDIIFDLETDGLLDTVTTIHCLGMTVANAQAGQVFANEEPYDCLEDALEIMSRAKSLTGHNIIGYDLPVLKKILGWTPSKHTKIIDTLVLSRLCHTNLLEVDAKEKMIPTKLYGRHSLEAWGERLGILKSKLGEGKDDVWSQFTPEMADYCVQDVSVTANLKYHFESLEYSEEATVLEHQFAMIIQRQIDYGINFDVKKGQELYVSLLKRQEELGKGLRDGFGYWYVSDGELTPKKNNKARGYTAGCKLTKIKRINFNPNSRDHIALHLKKQGWNPKDFTPNGKPKIDEGVLANLQLPNCKELKEHFLISKRISQLAEGDNAWLKLERNGRLYGGVNTNGAVTGRCTHSHPNLAQVPASYSPYGTECRGLFGAGKNRLLVGCDADGLELRALAGYLKRYDGGKYAEAAVSGTKNDGSDIHTLNQRVLEISSRDIAKTFFYAFIYGAGDAKLGSILGGSAKKGRAARGKFLTGVEGLLDLTTRVKQVYRRRGHLIGLDGRRLYIRSEHSALNTLLQGAGAILMKKALCILDDTLKFVGYKEGKDYEFVANIHDEFQIEVHWKYAKNIATYAEQSVSRAGEYFEFGCPLSATSHVGHTWAETH
jgi:DNA polymerase I